MQFPGRTKTNKRLWCKKAKVFFNIALKQRHRVEGLKTVARQDWIMIKEKNGAPVPLEKKLFLQNTTNDVYNNSL